MSKLPTRLFIATGTFIIGVTTATVWVLSHSPKQELRVSIPDQKWVRIWFETEGLATKSINEVTKEAELTNLKTAALTGDDLEVRVWVDSQEYSRAYILRRSAGKWSAILLRGMLRGQELQKQEILTAPHSGWEGAWERLVEAGMLTLPDASEIQCRADVLDGIDYIVEVNKDSAYRTYMYDNPQNAKCDEAKQMMKIAEILEEEFGGQDSGTTVK